MGAEGRVSGLPRAARRALAPVREAGQMAGFSLRAVSDAPGGLRYFAETLRQCSALILGSTVVLCLMTMVIGGECGLFFVYLSRPLGAAGFTGVFELPCGLRELFPYLFGYMFAAKVGCGLVAEIGSMRISEEIDALESVGMDPMRYVVATRLLAVWICAPLIYLASIVTGVLGGVLAASVQLGDLSVAQFLNGYWSSQGVDDNVYSLIKAFVMATTIALVGMYYGYRARGGPVDVGNAVARSMIVNLVLVHVIAAFFSAVFYGNNPAYPIGG